MSGIEAISYYIPRLYVDLKGEWAQKRSSIFTQGDTEQLISKIEKGIGVTRMSVPDAHEDVVTMGAMAAKRLLEDHAVNLSEISHIIVATETGVDHSKALSTYILGLLESYFQMRATHIGCIEQKFACVSGTYALESALALVDSKRAARPYVMVITTDIAKYDMETSAEYTQGAGAIAFLVGREGCLLTIDEAPFGTYTRDERDFYRPLWKTTPIVDGKYSMDVYCDCVHGALTDYTNLLKLNSTQTLVNQTNTLLFHLPFPKMASYAAAKVLFPLFHGQESKDIEERKKEEKAFMKSDAFLTLFKEKVTDSLSLSSLVGNLYTGSLFLGLITLIENRRENQQSLIDQSVLFFSYGSGASSKVFRAKFSGTSEKACAKLDLTTNLKPIFEGGTRLPILFDDYVRLHRGMNPQEIAEGTLPSVVEPKDEFVFLGHGIDMTPGTTDYGLRKYTYIK